MDAKRQFELEKSVTLPSHIGATWYADDTVRYTGGFCGLHTKLPYTGIWGYVYMRKETAHLITVKVRKWKWFFILPILHTASTEERIIWSTTWDFKCESRDDLLYFLPSGWCNASAFDGIKSLMARHGIVPSEELMNKVFSQPVDQIRRINREIYGHD